MNVYIVFFVFSKIKWGDKIGNQRLSAKFASGNRDRVLPQATQ